MGASRFIARQHPKAGQSNAMMHSPELRKRAPSRVAVVVPVYQQCLSKTERYSFDTTVEILRRHDLFIVGPHALKDKLSAMAFACRPISVYSRTFGDAYFRSVEGYNELMRSLAFYQAFSKYESVLIVQTDALVFSDQLDRWCDKGYSYVGAPWFAGLNKPCYPLTLAAAGNGGLSLRRVADFLEVLSRPRHVPNLILGEHANSLPIRLSQWVKHKLVRAYNFDPLFPDINEDFFWGLLVPRVCSFFTVPTPEEACAFAFEREPRFLYELNSRQLPFGCHGWEKYDPEFWRSVLTAGHGGLKPLP